MTVIAIKEKLKTYIDGVDDQKAKALYTLLKEDIEEHDPVTFTKEQLQILDEEHELHISGKTRSYNWEEAKEIIRGKKTI